MRLSYPQWRKRADRCEIADCDDCEFWRRYIVLCDTHNETE